jgi:NifU-like protein involved in Fe-S cluster formation
MSYSVKVIDHYENPRNVGSFGKEETMASVPAWSARRPAAT